MKHKKTYAIVTGASTGIGRAIAIKLAKNGSTVGLIARSKNNLDVTAKMITKLGSKTEVFPLDLRDKKQIFQFGEQIKKTWVKIHIIVNAAGIYHNEQKAYYNIPFQEYSHEDILTTYEVGLVAPTLLVHSLLPFMERNSHIINISGTFENGAKGWLPYFVSKRALEDFTIGLAQDLKDQGIFVNCISPSDTATESYKKFFPQYFAEAMDPHRISEFITDLCKSTKPPTGKIFVLKKDQKPYEKFHA